MTLRELKYVILGDDRLSDKMQRISGASDKATKSLGAHNTKLDGLKSKFTEATSSIPVFGSAMGNAEGMVSGMSAALGVGAIAVVGIGLALRKGINEASQFNLEFRKLENINLDKTDAQIEQLRTRILKLSGKDGFDAKMFSQGYFDIQSLTGRTGAITEFIVKSQAEFARATGADQNKYIAGTGIAMKNFGFGPDQMEAYNRSSMGLVATAKITYDQLAEVSAMYAGPAAAANQTFNSANKLMAIFTTKTKSAEEAATLTKQAFTDLFKKTTRDSFKSIGIDLYDIHGNAKQVDQIMLELNQKFATKTSARAMDELRNKFAGSEGINALLSAAKDQSGGLLNTLNQFDKGGAGLEKMLKSAKTDINILNDQVNNKLKSGWIRLGEAVLPTWIKIKSTISDALDMLTISEVPGMTAADLKRNTGIANDKDYFALQRKYASEISEEYFKIRQAERKIQYGPGQIPISESRIKTIQALSLDLQGKYGSWNKPIPPPDPDPTDTPPDSTLHNGINSISGGGTRNVTVHFDKLVETFNVNTTNLTDSSGKIKTDIEAIIVRAIAGSEQIISAN